MNNIIYILNMKLLKNEFTALIPARKGSKSIKTKFVINNIPLIGINVE